MKAYLLAMAGAVYLFITLAVCGGEFCTGEVGEIPKSQLA
jgi:hypothetical protein